MSRARSTAGLACVVLLAFAIRALAFPSVFTGDGEVIFAIGDAYYHARRALFSFENFPAVLLFDRYLNYPAGAHVPFPPFYDFVLAATARATGGGLAAFESTLAWFPAFAGALTALPIYLAGKLLGGRAVGLAAALIATTLPLSVQYSEVGNADHHGAVACLGAILLWLYLEACRDAIPRRRRIWVYAGLVPVRLAILLSWGGSLLYLGLGEALLAALLAIRGGRSALTAASLSAWATALLAAAAVALLGTPTDGPYSAVEVSRLHVLLFVVEGSVLGALSALELRRPAVSALGRATRSLGMAGVFAAGLLALPEVREGLEVALRWMGKTGAWGERNAEQFPLFGGALSSAESRYGYFAYLVPIAPLAGLLRARRAAVRTPSFYLALWTGVLAALTLQQVRYGNDLAAGAGVAFALLLSELAGLLQRRGTAPGWARAAAATAGCVLLASAFLGVHVPKAVGALRLVYSPPPGVDPGLAQPTGSLVRFARMVRAATPETSGYLDGDGAPEYGILCHPNIGHVLHYIARRATPADNFGPYIGRENFELAFRFFDLPSETEAVEVAQQLRTPYVITMDYGRVAPDSVAERLHLQDGLAVEGAPRFERFRLVTEGPRGGLSLARLFGVRAGRAAVPYKLFELVEGAVIEARAEPGTPVAAQVAILTPTGRRFLYRAETRAGEDGVARLRVPYATRTQLPARPVSPYRVRVGETAHAVAISDDQVRRGAVVPVPPLPRNPESSP